MARKPTPNNVLKNRGSRRVRDEIEPSSGDVTPTRELSQEAKRAWDRICAELDAIGVLSPAYADLITMAASNLGVAEVAARDLDQRGHISITERGETKNPSFTVLATAEAAAHKLLSSLGLTPTTIGKLGVGKKENDNEFAEF